MELLEFNQAPSGFYDCLPTQLTSIFSGPSLIHLEGIQNPPLLISTLLHGNETSGIRAVQKLLGRYNKNGQVIPRSICLFIGNPQAAQVGLRILPGSVDYNRIWAGGNGPENQMADQLFALVKKKGVRSSVDIHNNTGQNPFYSCVNTLSDAVLSLANLFSPTIVYATKPQEVFTVRFSQLGPAVTLECGMSSDSGSVDYIEDFLERCLRMEDSPPQVPDDRNVSVYHTIGRLLVPENADISFEPGCKKVDFCFASDIDTLNFRHLYPHRSLGVRNNSGLKLQVINNDGVDVADTFIYYHHNRILLAKEVFPAMLTLDKRVIFQDCLGYFMERINLRSSKKIA